MGRRVPFPGITDSDTDHPIAALVAEHEVILAVLDAMEMVAGRTRASGRFDSPTWARFPEFLRNFADRCHHGKEEDLLFPRLVVHGVPDAGGPVGVMKHEHVEGRALVQTLAAAIERNDANGAIAAAHGFILLLREHIAKENGVLFPLGKQLLLPHEVDELRTEFARAEREIMGEGTHCKYVDLARQICADAGVDMARTRGEHLGGCCHG